MEDTAEGSYGRRNVFRNGRERVAGDPAARPTSGRGSRLFRLHPHTLEKSDDGRNIDGLALANPSQCGGRQPNRAAVAARLSSVVAARRGAEGSHHARFRPRVGHAVALPDLRRASRGESEPRLRRVGAAAAHRLQQRE
jgi:hypothetical protein